MTELENIDPNKQGSAWFCDGYNGQVLGIHHANGKDYEIWVAGEMKVYVWYDWQEEVWRSADDIETSLLFQTIEGAELTDSFLTKLECGEVEGVEVTWDNNNWFEAFLIEDCDVNYDVEPVIGHYLNELFAELEGLG